MFEKVNSLVKSTGSKLSTVTGKAGLTVKKHSPEILMAAGIGLFVGTIFMAVKAGKKHDEVAEKIFVNHANLNATIEECEELGEELGKVELGKMKLVTYSKDVLEWVKVYAPTIGLGAASVGCFLWSNKILRRRYIGAVAAFNAVSAAYSRYRRCVVEEMGDEYDRRWAAGIVKRVVEEEYTDKKGNVKTRKKEVFESIDDIKAGLENEKKALNEPSVFSMFFDSSSDQWVKNDPTGNRYFLQCQQNRANDILQTKGYLFLNEVYEMLGLPATDVGAVVGWLKGYGDDYVDFHIYQDDSEAGRRFVNGYEDVVLLDFNVDGVIYDKLGHHPGFFGKDSGKEF